eukprot:12967302-Alexandrium_andersonii.AAC.1
MGWVTCAVSGCGSMGLGFVRSELFARGPEAGVRPAQQRGLGRGRPAHPRACCPAGSRCFGCQSHDAR